MTVWRRPGRFDLALSAALSLAMLIELALVADPRAGAGSVLAGAAMTIAVAFRRVATMAAICVACAALVTQEALDGRLMDGPITAPIVILLLAFSASRAGPIRPALAALATLVAALAAVLAMGEETVAVDLLFVPAVFCVAPFAAGRALHARDRQVSRLRAANHALEAELEQRAALAVAHEQLRLARELHDVVSHGVTTMILQAGAAEQLMGRDADRAGAALVAIQAAGGRTVDELRQMLGVLRESGGAAALAPVPTLGDLDDLVSGFARTGLQVSLTRTGVERPLPAGLELSAYRIVQEALTNVLKHAAVDAAQVAIGFGFAALTVEVRDEGCGPGPADPHGHGLLGMRERAAALGGRLEVGPGGGGFRILAELPFQGPG